MTDDGPVLPVVSFAGFELRISERMLLRAGHPVAIGGRALELLIALVGAAGRPVAKDELIAAVWGSRPVAENALQAQITALRRALGSERDLILTVSGRGYQFIGPLAAASAPASSQRPATELPERMTELVGRAGELEALTRLVRAQRLVTVIGAGGVGKTELAHELGRRMLASFPAGVGRAGLSDLNGPHEARAAIARELQARVGMPGARLVLLDGCERWIDIAARAGEAALQTLPDMQLLATSREPLRVDGESVFRLGPLGAAAASAADGAAVAGSRLFWQRFLAAGGSAEFEHTHGAVAARICAALDGLPLAIEMAAVRSARVGIDWVADHCDRPLAWLNASSRTAPRRHRSASALLDSSFALLTPQQRSAIRRLAGFDEAFSLDQASGLLGADGLSAADAVDCLSALVDKSLVDRVGAARAVRYRLGRLTRLCAARLPSEDVGSAGAGDEL